MKESELFSTLPVVLVLFFFPIFSLASELLSIRDQRTLCFAPQHYPLGFRCHLSSMRITNKGGQLGQCAHRRLVSPYFSVHPCDQFSNRSRGVGEDAVPSDRPRLP